MRVSTGALLLRAARGSTVFSSEAAAHVRFSSVSAQSVTAGDAGEGPTQRGGVRVWTRTLVGGGSLGAAGRAACQRAQHSRAHEDDNEGNAHRGQQQGWTIVCGAGVMTVFAAWQSQQHVLAEAEAVSLGVVGGGVVRMSSGGVDMALASSDAATLKPALGALILLAEDDDVDDTLRLILQVASKRILGHSESSVRAAAVCALAALVASDDKAASASLAGLVKSGAVAACREVLAEKTAVPDTTTRAAMLLVALSAYEGGWMSSGAQKSPGYMEAVAELARLALEPAIGGDARLAVVLSLGQVLGRKEGGGVGSSNAAAQASVSALSHILMPSRNEDAALKSAALQALSTASRHASLLPLVASSPTSERVVSMAPSENLKDSLAALEAMQRMAASSLQTAERLCIDSGAVQLIVEAAGAHRASKEIREAVAACMEVLIASNSEDCRMQVAHFATPVAIALARVTDEDMQMRALVMVRTLCLNGFNKFNMQKSFSVIQELVPFLARSDVRQQELVTECLAHMASTDNAMYGENARVLGEARAMKPLMVLARSKNHMVHRNATWALACMTGVSMRACACACEYLKIH